MPTITAIANPAAGNVYISVNWSDYPGVAFALLQRVVNGITSDVRSHISSDTATGRYQELSGGTATWYDTEMPLDTPVSYVTRAASTLTTASTSDVVVGSGGDLWLKDPTRPCSNVRITLISPAGSDCLPASGIFFASMGIETRATQSTLQYIDNSSLPTSTVRVRAGEQSTLNVVCRTFADRDSLLLLVQPGTPLLLQVPAKYGIPDMYLDAGDVPVERAFSDHSRQWRSVSIPITAMRNPAGLTYGTCGTRWDDLCAWTWGSATAAGLTWDQIFLGNAGPPGSALGLRTWQDVDDEFATWAAILPRTWLDVLDGS